MILRLPIFLLLPFLISAAEKPNLIYLMLDEWGYFESGHMGHKDLLTPNIDTFATEGMRFTNADATAHSIWG
jgi:arylsulfatase A-like enzyme